MPYEFCHPDRVLTEGKRQPRKDRCTATGPFSGRQNVPHPGLPSWAATQPPLISSPHAPRNRDDDDRRWLRELAVA